MDQATYRQAWGEIKELRARELEEHRDYREHMERTQRLRGEARGRFLALAAAIVGIVIPLLSGGKPIVATPPLAQAAVLLLLAIGVSALAEIRLRFLNAKLTEDFIETREATHRQAIRLIDDLFEPRKPTFEQEKKA